MAIAPAVMGVAGMLLRSFAYPLALTLAALFGLAGAASIPAAKAGLGGLLFGVVVALALLATYVYVVSGGGGPPSPTPSR